MEITVHDVMVAALCRFKNKLCVKGGVAAIRWG